MAGLVGFTVATVGAIALALVFASLSRRLPAQGGPYAYAREGFGDVAGFTNAWSYWCAAWPGNSGIVVPWVFCVQALFGWDAGNRIQWIIIALVGLWVPTFINLRGMGRMSAFQVVTTIFKFVPLVFLATVGVVIGFTRGNWPGWNPWRQHRGGHLQRVDRRRVCLCRRRDSRHRRVGSARVREERPQGDGAGYAHHDRGLPTGNGCHVWQRPRPDPAVDRSRWPGCQGHSGEQVMAMSARQPHGYIQKDWWKVVAVSSSAL